LRSNPSEAGTRSRADCNPVPVGSNHRSASRSRRLADRSIATPGTVHLPSSVVYISLSAILAHRKWECTSYRRRNRPRTASLPAKRSLHKLLPVPAVADGRAHRSANRCAGNLKIEKTR
jgi:hypothetical protein